ncbi:hypothetical protein Efla_003297 [Eimeria flavescens]
MEGRTRREGVHWFGAPPSEFVCSCLASSLFVLLVSVLVVGSQSSPGLGFSVSCVEAAGVEAAGRHDSLNFAGSGARASGSPEAASPEDGSSRAVPAAGQHSGSGVEARHPVFMLPGIAGTGLMVSANNAALPHCSSQPVTYLLPFRLWASISLVRPPRSHQLCWLDIMQPTVDESAANYASKEGLNIEVDGYGTAHGFDYLDYYYNERFGVPGTAYFHRMLQTFYSLGYMEGSSLLGVPYDWRLPPWQFDFPRLKGYIEARVAALGGRKADVLVHSLGSIVCNYFFNKVVDKTWKDKYINSYTLVAPATGGSFKAIKAILTGYNDPVDLSFWSFLDVSLIPVDILRDLSRNMGSIFALLPDPDLYGKDHVVLRQLLLKSSSSSSSPAAAASLPPATPASSQAEQQAQAGVPMTLELRRLAAVEEQSDEPRRVGAAEGGKQLSHEDLVAAHTEAQIRERSRQVQRYAIQEKERLEAVNARRGEVEEIVYTLGNWTTVLDADVRRRVEVAAERMQGVLHDPGVPTRCIWSMFAFPSTDVGYVYTGTDLSRKPIAVLDVGDDTVPLRSLSVCTGWASTFEVKTFKNLDHMFIFADGEFNKYIQLSFGSPSDQLPA